MTADPIGGVWRYAMTLCEALRPRGAQVLLATLGTELSPAQRSEVARFPHVELHESRHRLEWMDSPWESLDEAARWLLALAQEFRPTLIHLNHLVHADLAWAAPVMVVGHSCVLSWWNAVHGSGPRGWKPYRERVRQSLRAARLVVAPTRAMMRALESFYGPLPRRRVIPNGLHAGCWRPQRKENFILSVGRLWDAGKNVGALCRIADSVAWPIYVAGPDTSPDRFTQHMASVHALGMVSPSALAHWYGTASIYALPAHYEPFGLTALEAALSGCALVLGDIDSLREVWGDAARYVAPDDTAALRDTLNELIADPEQIARLAARARARARRYSGERFANRYWNIYQSLLAPEERPACASYSSITL